MAEWTSVNSQERDLWEGLRHGNELAFSQIYQRFTQELFGYAFRILQNRHEAKSVIHDLFLDLWRNREKLPQAESPKAYLITALRRRALRLKNQNRLQPTESIAEIAEHQPDGFIFSDEDIIIAQEQQQLLQQQITHAINRLPARQREIIYLRYYQELTIPEIAQTLVLSYQTVANHLQAAYRTLSKEKGIIILLTAATSLFMLFVSCWLA